MLEKEPYDQEVHAARAIHAGIDRYSESMGRAQLKCPTCGNGLVEQVEVTIDFRGGTSTPTPIR